MKLEFNGYTFDAQAAMGFVVSQTTHIEQNVYQIQYPDIQYPALIPVDTTAHPFAKSVTFYSQDKFGAADWINGNADDIPLAGTEMSKFETPVYTAGIGYSWGWEEIGQAMMLGRNLNGDDAAAARRAYEEMVDRVALYGDDEKGFAGGLFNYPTVVVTAAVNGNWLDSATTPAQIMQDINSGLTNVRVATNTVALADTLLLPYTRWDHIASTQLSSGSDLTILEFVKRNNIYTAQTGRPLTIRGERGLDDAGVSTSPPEARMVAYRRAPEVLKMHIPMPHRFLPVYQDGPLRWVVPGVFRLGGLDIRLPKEVSYIDGI